MNASQAGEFQFGGRQFNETEEFALVQNSNVSGSSRLVQFGWGRFGARSFARSEEWESPADAETESSGVSLTITNASGDLMGRLRTDVEKSIVERVEFTLTENGCADFRMKLNKLPDFPILPFSTVVVRLNGATEDWYLGEISYPDGEGTNTDGYEYRGVGLFSRLSELIADTTFSSGSDIGEVIADLVQNWVAPFSPINYNSLKIDTSTGVVLASDIELGKTYLDKVFETLSRMANFRFGVDADGDAFFEEKTTDVVKTHFVGYDVQVFRPLTNVPNVKNSIILQRQQGKGSGGAGWAIAGIYNDATSIAKYRKKELLYQIPGFFDTSDADVIGNALLTELKEPQVSAKFDDMPILSAEDFLERGVHRIIMPFSEYEEIVSDVDTLAEWTKFGVGDLSLSKETALFVHGDGSLKLSFLAASEDRAEITIAAKGTIEKLRFWVRTDTLGTLATVGVGFTNWNENTTSLPLPVANRFLPFEWDVSSLGLSEIRKFALKIDEDLTETANLFIDKIEVVLKGYRYYKLPFSEAKYRFSPRESVISGDFGVVPPRMENYLAGLLNTSNELRATQEVR